MNTRKAYPDVLLRLSALEAATLEFILRTYKQELTPPAREYNWTQEHENILLRLEQRPTETEPEPEPAKSSRGVKYAKKQILDSVWWLGFKLHKDRTVTIMNHGCDLDPEPAAAFDNYALLESDDGDRVAKTVIINGLAYPVRNQLNVFEYPTRA